MVRAYNLCEHSLASHLSGLEVGLSWHLCMIEVAHATLAFIDPRAALVTLALPQKWALIPYRILDLPCTGFMMRIRLVNFF